jgi:hypothetical protein
VDPCDSSMVKIICENQNTIQPKADVDSKPKSTPLKNLGQQQAKPMAQGFPKTNPLGGDEVPTRLASEGMRRSYDERCETTLTVQAPFIKVGTLQGN